MNISVNLLIHS